MTDSVLVSYNPDLFNLYFYHKNMSDKKGLRQCAKLQDLGEAVILVVVTGQYKVVSYFVGFSQNEDLIS